MCSVANSWLLFSVCRCGSRTGGPSVASSSRAAAVPKPGRPRRSLPQPGRAPALRAAASSRHLPSPARALPRLHPPPPITRARRRSAAPLPPSAQSPPSGARLSPPEMLRLRLQPLSLSPDPLPTPPVCSVQCQAPPPPPPPTPCPTTKRRATVRATPPRPALTSAA